MHVEEIENQVIEILKNANGCYLLPYQIFMRLKKMDPSLGGRIENEYASQPGNPPMGRDAGISYSPASFVAHALKNYRKKYTTSLDQKWLDTEGIQVEGIIPGNTTGNSIWAWIANK